MYGQINTPGGLGFSAGTDGTADPKTQAKLEALLKGLKPQMDIEGNAGTADRLKTPFLLRLRGDVTGAAAIDGSTPVSLVTTLSQTGAEQLAYFQLGLLLRERKAQGEGQTTHLSRYLDPFKNEQSIAITTGSFLSGKLMA